MIQGIGSLQTYLDPRVFSIDTIAGKRAVPVRPAYSIYAFKHVFGVPSRAADRQVPLGRLRVLDNLIDRLVKLRGERGDVVRVTPENVDQLVERFQADLHRALQSARPAFTGLFPETGLVVDLLA